MCIKIDQCHPGRQLSADKFSVIKSLAVSLASITIDFAIVSEWMLTRSRSSKETNVSNECQ